MHVDWIAHVMCLLANGTVSSPSAHADPGAISHGEFSRCSDQFAYPNYHHERVMTVRHLYIG